MSETRHTPGPWKADVNGIITGGDNYCTSIATAPVIFWRDRSTYGYRIQENHFEPYALEAEANARLIAAAPDLLEALKAFIGSPCVNIFKISGGVEAYSLRIPKDRMESAQAAIAKAEDRG